MRDFRTLQVWEKSHHLVILVYRCTETFPKSETFGLQGQVRRCAVSIPANIAEGCGKDSTAEFLRYMQISMGSASELEYLLMLSHEIGYFKNDDYGQLKYSLIEVRRMLNAYTRKVKENLNKNRKKKSNI